MTNIFIIKIHNEINLWTNKTLLLIICIIFSFCLIRAQSTIFIAAKKNFDDGKYEESKKLFKTIGKNSIEYGEARYYLGKICHFNRKFDEAINLFKEAIAVNNKNAEYYFWLGNSLGEKAMISNLVEQAILAKQILKNWEIGAKLDTAHQGIKWGLLNFYSQAPSIMGGNMDKAYKAADDINKLKYPDGFEAKGYVYERDNKKEEAEKSFKAAIKASPKEPKYCYALAYFYLRQNKIDNSLELFNKIIEINPHDVNAYYEIGRIYCSDKQKFNLGKPYLIRYLLIADPDNKNGISKANYYLGNIYNAEGDKANAKKCYDKALTLNPKFTEAKRAIEKL